MPEREKGEKKSTWIAMEPSDRGLIIYEGINPGNQVNIWLHFCR